MHITMEDRVFCNPSSTIHILQVSEILLISTFVSKNKTSTSVHDRLDQLPLGWSTLTGKCLEVVQTFGSWGFKLPSVEDSQKPQAVQIFMGFFLFYFSICIWVFLQRLTMSTTGVRVFGKPTEITLQTLGEGPREGTDLGHIAHCSDHPSLSPTG